MKNRGFTLIEVLLALFLTAILITILSVVFNTGLRAYRQGKDLMDITRKAQLLLGQMTRELPGAMVQISGSTTYIPFIGNGNSVYFVAPIDNNGDIDLCEVGYFYDSTVNAVRRHFLPYNWESGGSRNTDFEYPENPIQYTAGQAIREIMIDRVTVFSLQYRDASGWISNPPGIWTATSQLPELVEVSVTIRGEYPQNPPAQTKTFTTWIYLPNSTNN